MVQTNFEKLFLLFVANCCIVQVERTGGLATASLTFLQNVALPLGYNPLRG